MKYKLCWISFFTVCCFIGSVAASDISKKYWSTTDHSNHDALNKNFTSGNQITKACVECHNEADTQFHKTIHWRWQVPGSPELGKAGNSINNFCISSNRFKDKSCNDCHPAWNGKTTEGKVNCLVCHSRSTMNFNEAMTNIQEFTQEGDADSLEMAQEIQGEIKEALKEIGLPTRENCGACHFYGGGGDGVKHGDLDSSLNKPTRKLDVHMGTDGGNFSCTRCHTTHKHRVAGRMYTIPAAFEKKSLLDDDQTSQITCISCHGRTPHHDNSKLDDHIDKVACQSCHIPLLAREKPTKIWWDWSKAGKKKDGKPYRVKGDLGKFIYMSHKGEMTWAKNVMPEYFWFNGSISGISAGEKFDPTVVPVWLSKPVGNKDNRRSLIYPFKVHRGNQPYDTVHNTFLTPLLSGKTGYWGLLDWDRPFRDGAKAMGTKYSGKYSFVRTNYVYPSTHMVAPKEDALSCKECHSKDGRLRSLAGFYMPGRDSNSFVDIIGWLVIVLSLLGVMAHGVLRFVAGRRRRK